MFDAVKSAGAVINVSKIGLHILDEPWINPLDTTYINSGVLGKG